MEERNKRMVPSTGPLASLLASSQGSSDRTRTELEVQTECTCRKTHLRSCGSDVYSTMQKAEEKTAQHNTAHQEWRGTMNWIKIRNATRSAVNRGIGMQQVTQMLMKSSQLHRDISRTQCPLNM